MRIGVDLMGGESPPQELIPAILDAQEYLASKGGRIVVFATKAVAKKIQKTGLDIECIEAGEIIEMNDSPLHAVRRKKKASMLLGLRHLAAKDLDAFVTTGNTGALVAGAWLTLPPLKGILRPALLALLPTRTGSVAVIDAGGNADTKAENLMQFARMGSAFQKICQSNHRVPRVGLLNIGIESAKGSLEVRKAYQMLAGLKDKKKFHFIGNIEGREVFEGTIDVLVTDGFTGNVFLKASEGISQFIHGFLKDELKTLKVAKKELILESLQGMFSYDEYPGAVLCGVKGVVIKCHGASSSKGLLNGIKGAAALVEHKLITKLEKLVGKWT